MKIPAVLTATFLVLGLGGCASSNDANHDEGLVGEGIEGANAAPDTNPDGVPYPGDKIGTSPRSGKKPGNRIANYKFLGYPNGDPSAGLQPISLAQYFDPTGTKYKIIHMQAVGSWCPYCKTETKVVVPMKAELEAKGVVWLVSLAEGSTPGTPSKQKDLQGWIATFKSPFTHWLDPGNANLGPFYDRSALPWNADIDATTMEILTSHTGAITTREGILREVDNALQLAAKSTLRNNEQ